MWKVENLVKIGRRTRIPRRKPMGDITLSPSHTKHSRNPLRRLTKSRREPALVECSWHVFDAGTIGACRLGCRSDCSHRLTPRASGTSPEHCTLPCATTQRQALRVIYQPRLARLALRAAHHRPWYPSSVGTSRSRSTNLGIASPKALLLFISVAQRSIAVFESILSGLGNSHCHLQWFRPLAPPPNRHRLKPPSLLD